MRGDGHTDADLCVALPGGRRARVVAADSAGETRLHILDGDWLDRLLCLGLIDQDQHAAGVVLAGLYEQSGLRAHTGARYDGMAIDGLGNTGSAFERMTACEARAWRRLHRLLCKAPLCCRPEVEAVALHGLRPISVTRLRIGLAALAAAIRAGR